MDLRQVELPAPGDLATRVLHAPIDVAGQATLSVQGLRELGVTAHAFAAAHPYRYAHAPDIVPASGRRAFLIAAARAIHSHDVLHFHYGESFVRDGIDARLAARLGRRVVVEFHGSDVRMPSVELARNPHYVPIPGEDDAKALALLRRWSTLARGHAILCDHGLETVVAKYFAHVHIVGHRVQTRTVEPAPPAADRARPVLVHSPSDLTAKGTHHVRAAVAALRARGFIFEYVEVTDLPQSEARGLYRRADLVVDQLCIGTHGVFAAEAMALAKPVVCFMLEELVPTFPDDLPIINASPLTITDVLADWLAPGSGPQRRARGLASRRYAERVHDTANVARRLLHVYASLR